MTGPFDSVIGVDKAQIVKKFLTMMPERFEIAKGGVRFNGVLLTIDEADGKTISIERLDIKHEQ